MCIINQQVVGQKSAMPYDYPRHVADSSRLSTSNFVIISNTISNGRANDSLQCNLASKQILKSHITRHTYKRLIHTREQHDMCLLHKHKLMTSPSGLMQILLHFYSCEKAKNAPTQNC